MNKQDPLITDVTQGDIDQDSEFEIEDFEGTALHTDRQANCHYQEFSASGTGEMAKSTKTSTKTVKSSDQSTNDHHSIFALSAANTTFVDEILDKYILKPILPHIPRAVHPNHISILNTFICWIAVFLAFGAVSIEDAKPTLAFGMRLWCSALLCASLVADCLDGLHARRTNQCSKLGEVLDHSLDAANAILITSTILILFYHSVPIYAGAFGIPAAAFIYNAQLVIYGRENKWIVPPISGTHAQIIVITGQTLIATIFFLFGRSAPLSGWLCWIFSIGAIMTEIKDLFFNAHHMHFAYKTSHVLIHLKYVAISVVFTVLIIYDLISWTGFIYGNILISWYLNGRYLIRIVLSSKTRREGEHVPDGFLSPFVIGGIVVLAFVGYAFPTYREPITFVFCVSLAGLSLYELYANYPTIKTFDKAP